MAQPLVTVFGGSGFIGRHLVARLAAEGYRIRAAVRRPNDALFLKPMGDVGQIQLVQANIRHEASVRAAVAGADIVINLVGILFESGRQRFDSIHAAGAGSVAKAAADAGAKTLVHLSAIGADAQSASLYARSKAAGETAAREAFPKAIVIRPSIVFGPEDDFFNRFAQLATVSPVLPLIGGGNVKFQPVYVGDVADAILRAVKEKGAAGKTFELGGPKVYSFREIMEIVCKATDRERSLVPVPTFAASILAWFLEWLPKPMLTVDQVKLLRNDTVPNAALPGLSAFAIEPSSVEAITPTYLWRFRPSGQFTQKTA